MSNKVFVEKIQSFLNMPCVNKFLYSEQQNVC